MAIQGTELEPNRGEQVLWRGRPSQWLNFKYFFPSWLLAGCAFAAAIVLNQPLLFALAGLFLILPLWKWLVVYSTELTLTSERLKVRSGVFSRRTSELELYRVKDTSLDEPFILRLVSLGNIEIVSSDRTHPRYLIAAVKHPERLREQIRQSVERLRATKGVRELDME
jgi:uncharacterized membrane protein YdbT with pleckstrin-like domain